MIRPIDSGEPPDF